MGRVGSVPPACRGNLKEGVIGHTCFCELWLRDWYYTNRASEVHQLPPSFRFPPLREGNRERRAYSVPPACRGNLREGVINCCFFELWLGDWYKLPQGGRGVGGEGRKYEPPRYRQGGRVVAALSVRAITC